MKMCGTACVRSGTPETHIFNFTQRYEKSQNERAYFAAGIERLQQHIRQESRNYKVPCYVMKMDIRGYFMHINREKLLRICLRSLA